MKVSAVIPKKKGNHSQGSVERTNRHKGYLTLKPQQWDRKVDHIIKCKPPNVWLGQSVDFEKMLYQLQGDKVPKKWIIWKKDFQEKIVTKNPNWDLIMAALVDLTAKLASMVIHEVYHELNISKNAYVKLTYPEYGPF